MWQCTGEDWTEVAISFSTERPSLGVEPPELAADVLRAQKKPETLQVEEREQAIETTGLGGSKEATSDQLPGVDDGGEARRLVAKRPATIPSDGRPYRVQLSEYSTAAKQTLVCFPELAAVAISRSEQTHEAGGPLLAGPVDLVGESGPVGRTRTMFVAVGEKFELGWGPDPAITVSRDTEVKPGESKLLSSWIHTKHRVTLKLSNTSDESRRIAVTERVPVSEVPQVEIEVDPKRTTPSASPDSDGFVRWSLDLPAHGHQTVELAYTVSKKDSVVGV